jgi:hypothetical protein
MRRLVPLLLLLAAALAGCGGSGSPPAPTTTAQPAKLTQTCARRATAQALAKLRADVVALRRAAATPSKNTLDGGPAVSNATDRFLADLNSAPIDNLTKNRMIDHAAAAVVGSCEQCFQALEAGRPIPAIAHGEPGACAKS